MSGPPAARPRFSLLEPSPAGWALLLTTAAFLRLWNLREMPPGMFFDEAQNLHEIWALAERGIWGWRDRQPVYHLLVAPFYTLFGGDSLSLRLPSALFGILAIPSLYFFGRAFGGRRLGWIAAWLLAVSGWHIIFSRLGFRVILCPVLICLAGALLVRGLERKSMAAWVALGLVLGVGWFTYLAFWPVPVEGVVLCGWLLVRRPRFRPQWKGMAAALGIFEVFLLVWAVTQVGQADFLHPQFRHTGRMDPFSPEGPLLNCFRVLWMFTLQGDTVGAYNAPGWPAWPVFLAPFLLVGLWRPFFARDGRGLAVVALWGLLLLPTLFSEGCPNHLRSLGAVVPTALLTAQGLLACEAAVRQRQRALAPVLTSAVLVAAGALGSYTYFGAYAHQPRLDGIFQVNELAAARLIHRAFPDRTVVFVDFLYGRMVDEYILREHPRVEFVRRMEEELPEPLAGLPRGAVWVVKSEDDRRRVEALRGPLEWVGGWTTSPGENAEILVEGE